MPAVFGPRANLVATLAVLGLVAPVVVGIGWWWSWPRTDYWNHLHWTIAQPVPFSHQHHVGGLGLDCRFCHTSVEVSSNAGLPPTYTCMTCHSQIWTNAALLAPVRQSLAENKPIVWNGVTNLPDYVYFNHSIHIAKGVGCSSCHGDVARMPLMYKAKSLTMQFCVDCHSNPGPRLRPKDQIYNTQWHRTADTPAPDTLLAEYRIGGRTLTDCSICHR
ncbi:MAG TPA: cytochrome c3 family protein [Dongiaceae bacterium]|nr:cytochrome c3 family protein [Dongiaceae bacterium]